MEFEYDALFNGNPDCYHCFLDFKTIKRIKQELYNSIEKILFSRRKEINSLIKFTLITPSIHKRPDMVLTVDGWISYILKSNVKHLKIKVGRRELKEKTKYFVPQVVLNAVSLLVRDLSHCKLHLFSIDNLALPLSKKLSLNNVYADNNIMSKLIAKSPLIEDMNFIYCYGIKSL